MLFARLPSPKRSSGFAQAGAARNPPPLCLGAFVVSRVGSLCTRCLCGEPIWFPGKAARNRLITTVSPSLKKTDNSSLVSLTLP